MSLAKLVEVSNYFGSDPELVLAGGGNTSFKDDKYLYIKGSGTTLATITENGFVKMDRKKLHEMWSAEYPADTAEREKEVAYLLSGAKARGEEGKRPSVETSLHELLPQQYVVHLHPAAVNGITCSKEGKEAAQKLFGDSFLWIDPVEPGWILATEVKKQLDKYLETHETCDTIILGNHGIFVADDDPEKIKEKYAKILSAIREKITEPDFSEAEYDFDKAALLAPAIRMLTGDRECKDNDVKSAVVFKTNKAFQEYVSSEAAFEPLSRPYTPDHIVYCRAEFVFVKKADDMEEQYSLLEKAISDYRAQKGFAPRIVAVEGLGVFACGSTKKNADIAMLLFTDALKIATYTKAFGGHSFLSEYLTDFIVNWEVESYRSSVALGSVTKRISGKVIIVTGGAQGFGEGIAVSLLENGANVVIADLNEELAAAKAAEFCAKYGAGRSIAVKTDVSDEDSVKNMVYTTALTYGGLDCMVSNAGIARSGNIEEMSKKLFELHNTINYTGYFICSKFASRIMKIQYRFCENYHADIIQVNSKSGLVGSNKNFAYAGSKFGGIGLTQSFALELVDYNIKVNSVCPGNYFEGPLWSDPEKGLFKLYLLSGKAPGAKTVEDVKKFYESKIPMKKGCLPTDVAKAIIYCIEQLYETGQAIPVTGGQVMLS